MESVTGADGMADEAESTGSEEDSECESWTAFEVRKQALKLLAHRGHSRAELENKLVEREVPTRLADEVCDELADEGRIDDVAFARHQGEILRDRQWGPRQIRRKLGEHGVDEGIVDLVLDEIGGREVWVRGCWNRLRDRFGAEPGEFERRTKERAYRHLTHRGFRPATVRQILFDGLRPDDASP